MNDLGIDCFKKYCSWSAFLCSITILLLAILSEYVFYPKHRLPA